MTNMDKEKRYKVIVAYPDVLNQMTVIWFKISSYKSEVIELILFTVNFMKRNYNIIINS